MNALEGETKQEKSDPLDQMDMLIEHFRPIEKLFQLMGLLPRMPLEELHWSGAVLKSG